MVYEEALWNGKGKLTIDALKVTCGVDHRLVNQLVTMAIFCHPTGSMSADKSTREHVVLPQRHSGFYHTNSINC